MKKLILFIFISLLNITTAQAETLTVLLEGNDDGIKTTIQDDRKEALMDAKLRAIERAGMDISSITVVENLELKYDKIESSASGILLPGFQVLDKGYQSNGSYLVILSGQIKTKEAKTTHPLSRYLFSPISIMAVFLMFGFVLLKQAINSGYGTQTKDKLKVLSMVLYLLPIASAVVASFAFPAIYTSETALTWWSSLWGIVEIMVAFILYAVLIFLTLKAKKNT
jgi:hypothetical protein